MQRTDIGVRGLGGRFLAASRTLLLVGAELLFSLEPVAQAVEPGVVAVDRDFVIQFTDDWISYLKKLRG